MYPDRIIFFSVSFTLYIAYAPSCAHILKLEQKLLLKILNILGQGCSSVVEYLLSMCKAMSFLSLALKKKKKKKKKLNILSPER
jgi:hypothetical protein